MQAVVAHLLKHGQNNLEVCSDWPDVFSHLNPRKVTKKDGSVQMNPGGAFDIAPFARSRIDVVAHYSGRKTVKGTSQMEDCFISAKLPPILNPELKWRITNPELTGRIQKAAGARRIVFFQHLRPPMDRKDGFGDEMVPSQYSVADVLSALKRDGDTFVIKIGQGESLDSVPFDMDLRNRLTVKELLDVACVSDLFVGQCSLIIPLSECLGIPCVILFGHGIRSASHPFIRSICPEKLLLRHNRNGCIELGLWDDDREIKTKVQNWFAGLRIC